MNDPLHKEPLWELSLGNPPPPHARTRARGIRPHGDGGKIMLLQADFDMKETCYLVRCHNRHIKLMRLSPERITPIPQLPLWQEQT